MRARGEGVQVKVGAQGVVSGNKGGEDADEGVVDSGGWTVMDMRLISTESGASSSDKGLSQVPVISRWAQVTGRCV